MFRSQNWRSFGWWDMRLLLLLLFIFSKPGVACSPRLFQLLGADFKNSLTIPSLEKAQAGALWLVERTMISDHRFNQSQEGIELQKHVAEKFKWFHLNLSADARSKLEQKVGDAESVTSALQVLLRSFSNQQSDSALHLAVLNFIEKSNLPVSSKLEALLPIVRGNGAWSREEVKRANELITQLQWKHASDVPDLMIPKEYKTLENFFDIKPEAFTESPITDIKRMGDGSGINETYVINFQNGNRAIFKPLYGENSFPKMDSPLSSINFIREANAHLLYKKYFSHPKITVPITIEAFLNHNGKSYGIGSIQMFKAGYNTVSAKYDTEPFSWNNVHRIWERQRADLRWSYYAPWVQTFDYILGNVDRFPHHKAPNGNPNNLLVQEDLDGGLKVALIDNAKGRGYRIPLDYLPNAKDIPQDLRERIKSIGNTELNEMRYIFGWQLSDAAIEDIISRIKLVQQHIQNAGL